MTDSSSRIAVYTGSFDPITLGHLNVIERASRVFDKLVVGVGENPGKTALFSARERVELVALATASLANVETCVFDGLSVQFVRDCGARVLVRGVRPLTDIAAEITMMLANRELACDVETIFLMADQRFAHVSSSLLKEISSLADDEMLARFVPAEIIPRLRRKLPGPDQEFLPLGSRDIDPRR